MIEVYHAKTNAYERGANVAVNPDDFQLVAKVDTNDKEVAFEKTNHIDSNWTTNSGLDVIVIPASMAYRSTSVGDLMIDEEGTIWMVDTVGFQVAGKRLV